ncbi:MAG: 16S rRNA (guanine527-N7)-methyltransferase [Candidatus Azotimanducaceae bacterium]|jgi:16S rRNA (guanine527-N7)-methyltransferase
MALTEQIQAGAASLQLSLTDTQVQKLSSFLELIVRWNKVTNLTSVRDINKMVPLHLMDSLSVAGHIRGRTIVDVGSGAGLPGIPLALLYADKDFILLDSNGKKARFMTQALIELELDNVRVVHARVEDFEGSFDHVICRAFRPLDDIIDLTAHLVAKDGSLLAMKGPAESEKQENAQPGRQVHSLVVPGIEARRYLIEISR